MVFENSKNTNFYGFAINFIIIVLSALLFEVLFNKQGSLLVYILRIIVLVISLVLAFLIFYDLKKQYLKQFKEIKRLRGIYELELLRKDKEIERINKETEIIMKSALKQSDKARMLADSINQLDKKKGKKD
jgi:hypothetical protein